MSNYFEGKELSNIYLEDSFVLGIAESESAIVFDIEFVLTESHPQYCQPKIGEQYCYRKGKLKLTKISPINWKRKSITRSLDANGEADFGNIDEFRDIGGGIYELSGDWGDLVVALSRIEVILD